MTSKLSGQMRQKKTALKTTDSWIEKSDDLKDLNTLEFETITFEFVKTGEIRSFTDSHQ